MPQALPEERENLRARLYLDAVLPAAARLSGGHDAVSLTAAARKTLITRALKIEIRGLPEATVYLAKTENRVSWFKHPGDSRRRALPTLKFFKARGINQVFEGRVAIPGCSASLFGQPWRIQPLLFAGRLLRSHLRYREGMRLEALRHFCDSMLGVVARGATLLCATGDPSTFRLAALAPLRPLVWLKVLPEAPNADAVAPLWLECRLNPDSRDDSPTITLGWGRGGPPRPPSVIIEFANLTALGASLAQANDSMLDLARGNIRMRGNVPHAEALDLALQGLGTYIPPQ